MQIPGGSTTGTTGGIGDKITVGLQDMYSYSVWLFIVLILIALIPPVIWLINFIKKKHQNVEVNYSEPVKAVDLSAAKLKYTQMLAEIIEKYKAGKLNDRQAYQQLSKVIRHFVYDVTKIKVQNYTLNEIRLLNIPMLYYLIDECYEPEFSKESGGNIIETCEKARQVISGWN